MGEHSMTTLYILVAACVAVAVPTGTLRHIGWEKSRLIAKLTASILFCMVAFLAVPQRAEPINTQVVLMLMALMMGLMGDIVLGLDKFVPEKDRGYLLIVGGAPFFFGHILYIALLLSYGNLNWWLFLLTPVLPALYWLIHKKLDFGKNLYFFLLYSLVLNAMMISTFNLALQGGELGRLMILPGLLFTISDSSLFLNKYGAGKLGRVSTLLFYTVPIPYFAAQALFALSVVYL